jgi:beta-lactamase class A
MGPKRLLGLAVIVTVILSSGIAVANVSDATPSAGVSNDNVRIRTAMLDLDGKSRKVGQADERFAMCSTFKFLAVAAVLQRVDRGQDKLDRFIKYSESDILAWAPMTKQHLGQGGMTLEALCFAAIAYSDNTAGNLLLQILGGPAGLTAYARRLGDDITRLDRTEPELNNVARGDVRDTTSPMTMLHDMQKILLGDALSVSMREKLESWMIQNTTGDAMIRAGVPWDWRVGDKTGQNQIGNSNDIAIIRRPDGRAVLLCIYVDAPGEPMQQRAIMIADVTRELMRTGTLTR